MRILSVNHRSDLYGASRCIERVLPRLVEEGHEVYVVLPGDGPLVPLLKSRGIRVLYHPRMPIIDRHALQTVRGALRFVLSWPGSVLWLAMLILRLRIDTIHTNTAMMPTPGMAARLTGRRHVWHVRDMFGEFGSLWTLYRGYIYAFSTKIIAISEAVRGQFAERMQGKVVVIYDGLPAELSEQVDPGAKARFREHYSIPQHTLIGVVGRIKFVRKGQEILVEAFARLMEKFPDTHLVIVGSAAAGNEEHLDRLKALIALHSAADRVTFTGDLETTAPVFAAMDITVVPSIQAEPFGCVVMESMAAGTVVVGSNCGGIPEQIIDGESGLLFTPGAPGDLADCLNRLLADTELRARLARGGKERYLSCFRLDQTVADTLQVFQQPGKRTLQQAVREA